jgi:hypothetical protein
MCKVVFNLKSQLDINFEDDTDQNPHERHFLDYKLITGWLPKIQEMPLQKTRKHRSSCFKMHMSNTLHNIKFVWESGLSTSNLGVCSHAADWVDTPIKLPRQQTCTKGFPYGFFTPCPQGCNPVSTRQSIVWKSGCTVRSKNNLLSKLLCCFVLTFTNVSIWHAHMTLKFTDEHWILCHYPCYGPVCTWTCPQCQLISAEISY